MLQYFSLPMDFGHPFLSLFVVGRFFLSILSAFEILMTFASPNWVYLENKMKRKYVMLVLENLNGSSFSLIIYLRCFFHECYSVSYIILYIVFFDSQRSISAIIGNLEIKLCWILIIKNFWVGILPMVEILC